MAIRGVQYFFISTAGIAIAVHYTKPPIMQSLLAPQPEFVLGRILDERNRVLAFAESTLSCSRAPCSYVIGIAWYSSALGVVIADANCICKCATDFDFASMANRYATKNK